MMRNDMLPVVSEGEEGEVKETAAEPLPTHHDEEWC